LAGHEVTSIMLYVHPPLAILGYLFIFAFAVLVFRPGRKHRMLSLCGVAAWLLTFLGLLTGMIWAQTAWGNYWSWDPKETMTLLLFLTVSAQLVTFYEQKAQLTKYLALSACILSVLTASTSFVLAGLHSFV
jgi:ABC-type transport system involved in cytochrome c biogenesis permease subunit